MSVFLEIKSCIDCPNLQRDRFYTADSWETETEYKCKSANLKRIGVYDWTEEKREKVVIPNWCPLKKAKE